MKLSQLLQEYDNPIPHNIHEAPVMSHHLVLDVRSDLEGKGYKRIGSGIFATVYAHPDHDDHVIKVHHQMSRNDGYLNFIHSPEVRSQNNPHFPRIHSIDSYHHAKGGRTTGVHIIRMEKLYGTDDLNTSEHQNVLSLIGHKKGFGSYETHENLARDADTITYWRKNRDEEGSRQTKSPLWLSALRKVGKLVKQGKGAPDLHGGNIMYRRTPYGHQPVITDPLA